MTKKSNKNSILNIKNLSFKHLNSNWIITLFSTMIGVIAGFYLTNYSNHKSLITAKEKALSQVSRELSDNKDVLQNYHDILEPRYSGLIYIFSKVSPNNEIIIHQDSLNSFLSKTDSIFSYTNHIDYGDHNILIHGDLNLEINSKLILHDLTNVVWNSFKQTDYLTVTKFECITQIESAYLLQEDYNQLNQKWRNLFFEGEFMASNEKRQVFFKLWQDLLFKQKFLLNYYEINNQVLTDCI